jgi:hypothetical protein
MVRLPETHSPIYKVKTTVRVPKTLNRKKNQDCHAADNSKPGEIQGRKVMGLKHIPLGDEPSPGYDCQTIRETQNRGNPATQSDGSKAFPRS